jgi:tetratricopeptide (TPR) repeat protein
MTRTCLPFVALPLLGLLVGSSGCRSKAAPKAEPAAEHVPAPAPAPAADDGALAPSMRLALQELPEASSADAAVASAQAAARALPGKDESWVLLGRAWVRKARESNDPGFYLNADACAAVVLARSPDQAMALDLRGLVLLNQHKFEAAQELASKVVAKHPEDPMAWGTSSDALLELGRYDEAAEAVQRMVELKPNLPSYSRASHIQWLNGSVRSAKDTVRLAIDAGRDAKREPEPGAWVLVQAAMIFWHEGDYEGAEAGFDRALERLSDFAPATAGKGRVAMARRDFRHAAELFARSYKASPLVETAWLLGDARQASGDAAGAAEAYALVEKDGKTLDPRTLSLFLSTKNQRSEEALRLAREEYAVRKDLTTEDALAWALYRNGKLDEAKASIAKARRLGTPDARLVYHDGAIRIAAGDPKRGRELVAQARKMNPAFDATGAKEADLLLSEKLASR